MLPRPVRAAADLMLPNGTALRAEDAGEVLQRYVKLNAAAMDLYDFTNHGPHDEIQAVDLLALNALNAFTGKNPMTVMEAMWLVRHKMTRVIEPITRKPLEILDEASLVAQLRLVVRALSTLELVSDYGGGGTRVAKLLHRLRPNIVPIWDAKVGTWYGGPRETWESFIQLAWSDIRRNGSVLAHLRDTFAPRLTVVRVWDALLWRMRIEEASA